MGNHVTVDELLLFKQILEKEFDNLIVFVGKAGELNYKETLIESLETIPEGNLSELLSRNSFPPVLSHSLLITAYSYWEYSLKKICRLSLVDFPQYKSRVSGFEKIHQYYSYLVDDLKLKPATWETDLTSINTFRNIRNAIVHHHSYAGGNVNPNTIDYLKGDPRVEFNDRGIFFIKDIEFVEDFILVSKRLIINFLNVYITAKNKQ